MAGKILRIKVRNSLNERLDVLIEGNEKASASIVFVHGFGTNKDEGTRLFLDISRSLKDRYRIIRFDLSGYGNSEGKQEEVSFEKQASDLEAILEYVRSKYVGDLYIIAHSMGTSIVLTLSPGGVRKTVFTGIPTPNMELKLDNLKRKILSRPGGVVNEEGMSVYPRTNGELQKIGPAFWGSARRFDPLSAMKKFSLKTDLILFRSSQDTGEKGTEEYRRIRSLRYVELNGDHAFTDRKDREELIRRIADFLK